MTVLMTAASLRAGVDLSGWRLAFDGSEMVRAATIGRFAERFASCGLRPEAMTPAYGLAEAGWRSPSRRQAVGRWWMGSTGPDLAQAGQAVQVTAAQPPPAGAAGTGTALEVVSCGRPLPGYQVRVVDAADHEPGERREGRIEFTGPSATPGYFGNEPATRALGDGDLGYLAGGELYLTGRGRTSSSAAAATCTPTRPRRPPPRAACPRPPAAGPAAPPPATATWPAPSASPPPATLAGRPLRLLRPAPGGAGLRIILRQRAVRRIRLAGHPRGRRRGLFHRHAARSAGHGGQSSHRRAPYRRPGHRPQPRDLAGKDHWIPRPGCGPFTSAPSRPPPPPVLPSSRSASAAAANSSARAAGSPTGPRSALPSAIQSRHRHRLARRRGPARPGPHRRPGPLRRARCHHAAPAL